MGVKKVGGQVLNKTNIRPVVDRLKEATAEDFKEIGEAINDHADCLERILPVDSPNKNFGTHQSLALLNASFPVGVDGGFALIDSGDSTPTQIVYWNTNTNQWELQVSTATTSQAPVTNGANVQFVFVEDADGNPHVIVSGTFVSGDPSKLEDYSKNSISRAL